MPHTGLQSVRAAVRAVSVTRRERCGRTQGIALGSGDVNVLGTPRLVALFEQATIDALRGMLDEGQSSVGMRVQVDHLQPTPVGAEIVVEAVLDKVEGRRITFTVTANDSGGLVAAGRVTRVLVEVERFMTKCCRAD